MLERDVDCSLSVQRDLIATKLKLSVSVHNYTESNYYVLTACALGSHHFPVMKPKCPNEKEITGVRT